MGFIYLAGAMACLSPEEANAWRKEFAFSYSMNNGIFKVFNPTSYFNYQHTIEENDGDYELECFKYETDKIKQASIVVVNLENIKNSVGTIQELAIAHDHQIPIIGFNRNYESLKELELDLHPWIKYECNKILVGSYAISDTANYVYCYYDLQLTADQLYKAMEGKSIE